jgi:hypothetical protein
MAGGWRISEEAELTALRHARLDARRLRTEESWNRFVKQVERCDRLGLLDEERDDRSVASRPDVPPVVDLGADDAGTEPPPRYAAAD